LPRPLLDQPSDELNDWKRNDKRLRAMSLALMTLPLLWDARAASAAVNDEGAVYLSLGDVERRAHENAPEIRIAEAGLGEVRAARVGADVRLPTNPRLSFDGRVGVDGGARGERGFASTLEVMFEVGDVPGARVREVEQRTEVARAGLAAARLAARLRAVEAYVGTKLSELRIQHAKVGLELAQRLVAAAQERVRAGAGTDIDVTSAQIEVAERTAEVDASEAERRRHEAILRRLLGLALDRPLLLTTSIEAPPPPEAPGTLLERALAQRPDLAALHAELALVRASDERLRKEAWPKVGAFAAVDASPASPAFGVLGMSVELPFAQRNQGPRAVLAARRQTILARLEALKRFVESEVVASLEVYRLRLHELEVLSRQGLPAARLRVDLVEKGWLGGRFDVFRMTAAAQDLVRLRARHVEVLQGIWGERMALQRLTGGWVQ
jgi:outer membrane protein, heavy metal efflux system